jgi:urea transporter/murein DD-endopeptidase MepM/ murein hydrolase activator NlpD
MNELTVKYYLKLFLEGFLNSYAQVYFSTGKLLAVLLILVTFFDVGAGLSGVIAVVITQLSALSFHFDHKNIREGTYSYNSAMIGVALGILYQLNFSLIIFITVASILTFLLTVWFMNQLAVKGLPFLSMPFLLVIWLVMLGGNGFSSLDLVAKTNYSLIQIYPELFYHVTEFVGTWPFADVFYMYFRSLGAILFQYNDLAGILIAVGILFQSRISFVLSLYGFVLGFLFYRYMEADFSQLIYSYIGFNFILTAIALGGFFIVASRRSLFLLVFVIPLIAMIISGTHGLFLFFNLPMYSLPFNITVLLVLYMLNQRAYPGKLHRVLYQHFSAEKNHYKYYNSLERFGNQAFFNISLPIIGFWRIPQGNDGLITHREDYRHALDFDVIDSNNQTYKNEGFEKTDYLCYDLPVISPANGTVVAVVDGIDDNGIGGVNLENNWGNTVVIKHAEYLYSKLSHLKKNSIEVKLNDFVSKGHLIGRCGNSGRSPEPHLHFQMQATPFVGSKTLLYPLGHYLTKEQEQFKLHSSDIPKEGELVSNITPTSLLSKAFGFIPGQILRWEVNKNGKKQEIIWEVFVSSLNATYLYCHKTKAVAYFVNDGTMFYFTEYYGNKGTLLHHFYKSAHRVLLAYYKGIEVKDRLLISDLFHGGLNFVHDFTAPAFHYLKSYYSSEFVRIDNEHSPSEIEIHSKCSGKLMEKTLVENNYTITLSGGTVPNLVLSSSELNLTATVCLEG